MIAGQLDLFAEAPIDVRAEWAARFGRASWYPQHRAHDPACAGALGWTCPSCGQVELNGYLLNLNHGYDPQIPGRQPWPGWGTPCSRMVLLASQERARAERAARGAA